MSCEVRELAYLEPQNTLQLHVTPNHPCLVFDLWIERCFAVYTCTCAFGGSQSDELLGNGWQQIHMGFHSHTQVVRLVSQINNCLSV